MVTSTTNNIIEAVTAVSKALLPSIVGVSAVYIAYQQFKIAKLKRKQEFYERCYPIYKATMKFIAIAARGKISNEALDEFLNETMEAKFLLGPNVSAYMLELHGRATDMVIADNAFGDVRPVFMDDDQKEILKLRCRAVMWFRRQLDDAATVDFIVD